MEKHHPSSLYFFPSSLLPVQSHFNLQVSVWRMPGAITWLTLFIKATGCELARP